MTVVGAALVMLVAGCSEKGGGDRFLNEEPDTFISYGPAEDSLTYYKVEAFWYGADDDGDIERFEVTTVKNVTRETLDSLELDLLSWGPTTSRESTFVLAADSCCLGGDESSEALAPWGILIRAVDNDGAVDPEPASVFFRATNVIPRARMKVPERPPSTTSGAIGLNRSPYFQWEATDPDGELPEIEYKYIVVYEGTKEEAFGGSRPLQVFYPEFIPPLDSEWGDGSHSAPPVGYWSEWVPADCTFVRDINLSVYAGTLEHLSVMVTARDEGGAHLPIDLFEAYNGNLNWVRFYVNLYSSGVTALIDAGALGTRNSTDRGEYETEVAGVFAGTEVSFRFWADEIPERGELGDAYRYYYDSPVAPDASWNYWTGTTAIRDPGITPQWFVRYPTDGSRFVPSLGRHIFVAEIRDLNKEVSHVEFNFEVLEGPARLPDTNILLVDDNRAGWLGSAWIYHDEEEDSLWADILEPYTWEQFDTGPGYDEELSIRKVGLATTVIWVVDQDVNTNTHLLRVTTELGNYLNSYVKVGGNLIIIGRDAVYAHAYWPDGTPDPGLRASRTSYDFRPKVSLASGDTTYNFNWEAFGIAKMEIPGGIRTTPFSALYPCEWDGEVIEIHDLHPDFFPTGSFGNAFYVTEVREDIEVTRLFTGAVRDSLGEWVPGGCDDHILGTYVPGDGTRGHAAYIGAPLYWFEHDKVKTLIRDLLEEFGETQEGS
jgi:hypothetical protein